MARALLSKSHLWRSNGFLNLTTRPLTYLLLHQTTQTPPTLFVSAPSATSSGHFRPPHRRFCAGAAPVESPLMQSMEKKIKDQLNAERVTVNDASGDGRHVSVYVISAAFEGQNTVNRQRMVYKAIWEELQDTVHAVHQMITLTPAEAKTKSQ